MYQGRILGPDPFDLAEVPSGSWKSPSPSEHGKVTITYTQETLQTIVVNNRNKCSPPMTFLHMMPLGEEMVGIPWGIVIFHSHVNGQ